MFLPASPIPKWIVDSARFEVSLLMTQARKRQEQHLEPASGSGTAHSFKEHCYLVFINKY